MTQSERRIWLIQALMREDPARYGALEIPRDEYDQRRLLRALMNLRPPAPAGEALLRVQDAYLAEELRRRGTTDAAALAPIAKNRFLWRGDITALKVDAIVNAANRALLGCFQPNHGCIDNAIHTCAGIQLRLACKRIMDAQGHEEPTGAAKITPGFNLPSRFVLHTVGPIVGARVTAREERLLASCYRACLDLADANGLRSVAFCCISTGEFRFPHELAAQIAVQAVRAHPAVQCHRIQVIFNVFRERDETVYRRLLRAD